MDDDLRARVGRTGFDGGFCSTDGQWMDVRLNHARGVTFEHGGTFLH